VEGVKYIVGVADMKISNVPGDVIVTHALGSCLGITIHDPVAQVGGLLHVMMPYSSIDRAKAEANPWMFVDTGLSKFFLEAYAAGAVKGRLQVKVAGGANVQSNGDDRFAIGTRNHIVLRKMFLQNNILIAAEDVGGTAARTLCLEIGSGRVLLGSRGVEREF